MPRALAIETSGKVGCVAILEDGQLIAEDQFPHGLKNAAQMIPRIDALCRARGWTPNDFNDLYVSIGPGSFTGLRIGVALAKTLAFITGARLVAVPSMRVLARNAPPEAQNLVIVLDAKRQQIFTARFQRDSQDWSEQVPAHLGDLKSIIESSPRPLWLLGEGIPYHRQFIPPGDPSIHITPEELWQPRASSVAVLGQKMAGRSEFTSPDQLLPLYIRKPEAEEVWERKQAAANNS